MKWKKHLESQMLLVTIKRLTSIFFMIVLQKARVVEEVFVTTVKRKNQGKKISQKIMLLIWQLKWASRFYLKNNIEIYKNLELLIRKHRAGLKHHQVLENLEVPSFVIVDTTESSCLTTARNLITPSELSVANFEFSLFF